MTEFGDFDTDDAYDPTAPADPEQVAIKLHELLYEAGLEPRHWDEVLPDGRTRRIGIMITLIAWLQRQGSMR